MHLGEIPFTVEFREIENAIILSEMWLEIACKFVMLLLTV